MGPGGGWHWKDHPRIRGEHFMPMPRADMDWIIPAYAGSTARRSPGSTMRKDHPRIRGEHNTDAQSKAFSAGSSPHTRGAPTGATTP